MRFRRLVGACLGLALVASVTVVTGAGKPGGAQTKKAGVGAPVEVGRIAPPPNVPKDGVVGERVDRASQASLPVEVLENSDPRVVSAITKAGSAPGPKVIAGPGEVPAVPAVALPVGAPSANELIAPEGIPSLVPVKPKDAVAGEVGVVSEIVLPPLPDETKLDEKAKAKRKRSMKNPHAYRIAALLLRSTQMPTAPQQQL